jgi:membrane carboxypeptidase/penicillin-binding protein PbpC
VSYSYTSYDGEQTYVVLAVDTSKVGTYTITYKAVDEFANETAKQRIVKVDYYPVHSLQIDSTNLQSNYVANSNISLKLNYSPNAVNPNTQITWLVNGKIYTESTGFSVDLKFDKAGEYVVVALDKQTNIKSNQIIITVKSNMSTYLPLIIVSAVVVCTICACAVLLIKKSKKGKLNVK